MPSHVLILGCGRSGTSIFGELFEAIAGYRYYSEPAFDDLARLSFESPVAIKVPTESASAASTPGLSFPLDAMLELIPQPRKLYWQVRHPLDTIASLRVGITNNWGHHPRPPDWQSWLNRPIVERCAHHWRYINSTGFNQLGSLATLCRFEDMLAGPADFAASICADVGVDEAANAPELERWSERVQDTNNDKFVEAKTSRPYSRQDHTRRLGRWRENLAAEELRLVVPMVRETAHSFDYSLTDEAQAPG